MDTYELVKNAICKVQPGIDEAKIVLDANLGEDLDIDSLGRVELALAIEESFGFYLPDEELEDVVTVGDAVALIDSKKSAKND
jgi:acyl carrier protein